MIRPSGMYFTDEQGRYVLLRGVNLGGSTKVPFAPDIPSHVYEGFFNHRDLSFVGRPFPLEEADEHFSRLQSWGFNCLRFLITWEAIEHQGPGIYDEEYLDYLYQVIQKAGEYGFKLFIDPHQDVWSRFTGGDGAPGWTLEAAGLDMTKFQATGAAIVHNTHGDPFPRMIWPTNYAKLAAATMFTLFFGGNSFAPKTKVQGVPIQDYLQGHYFNAIKKVAEKLKGLPQVLGYDTLNEPSSGWIGWQDLNDHQFLAKQGDTPTPWQAMLLGEGLPQEVEVWQIGLRGIRKVGKNTIDPKGERAWLPGHQCIWRANGVWDISSTGNTILLKPDHFAEVKGKAVDFPRDFMKPFIQEFTRQIRSVDPDATIFMEHEVQGHPAPWEPGEGENMVYAPHWYDPITLILKKYISYISYDQRSQRVVLGKGRVQKLFNRELGRFKEEAREMGQLPVLIGETGIAYDMHEKEAYKTGDFSQQARAMDRILKAMDINFLNYTLWNYTADNTNEFGDGWNGEDLSIFSRDQQNPKDSSGGRAMEAFVRPWAQRIAGVPIKMSFNIHSREFLFSFRHDPKVGGPTEIFIPAFQYPQGFTVEISDGSFQLDSPTQLLLWQHDPNREIHKIKIVPRNRS